MKAEQLNTDKIINQFPLSGTPKYDGIRMVVKDGIGLSNSMKVLPNEYLQQWVADNAELLEGCDGELIVGSPTDAEVFTTTTSLIRRIKGQPQFTYYIFDLWDIPHKPYNLRYLELCDRFVNNESHAYVVPSVKLHSMEDLMAYEIQCLEEGYEGVMLRGMDSKYKYGRATANGGELVKVKRFLDTEAVVIGFTEMHNKHGEPMDTLGAIQCAGQYNTGGLYNVSIGTGYTADKRQEIWNNRDNLMQEIVKFKYQEIGTTVAPRIPVFIGFRMKEDV